MYEWISKVSHVLCMRCCIRTNADDDFLKERWELSFSRSRCLPNIKLPVLALILFFYANAHSTASARYYWKFIFSLSFTIQELCHSSCFIKTSEDDDDALICSTSPTSFRCQTVWIDIRMCMATVGWVRMYKQWKKSS
jgi:hypothetical protein